MRNGIVMDVSLEELENLIRDSQKLADVKLLYEKCNYPEKEVRAILGVEEKKDGD